MIPQEKQAAVTRGLQEAFGVTAFEDIRQITLGNATTRVFRIVVKGFPFLLKIIMRTDDATRHFTCMKAAAAAGLAPRVHYAGIEDRLVITDFVEATAPLRAAEALVRVPAVLRTLHSLPPFARVPDPFNTSCLFLLNQGPALDGFLQKFREMNLLSAAECDDLLARYAQLAAAYPLHEPDMVSSHNDLFKPDNILFDGEHVWLVDWEAAFLNDRYADLAVVANMLVANEAEESVFLQTYFGRLPEPWQSARFFLMQQLAHIFYTMAFLFMGASGGQLSLNENAPDLSEFQRRFWLGEVNLKDSEMKMAYVRFHWEHLLRNMRHPRFDEAVRIVAERLSPAC